MVNSNLLYRFFVLSAFFLAAQIAIAQTCDWLAVGGGSGWENSYDVAVDYNNDKLIAIHYMDSFGIGSHSFPLQPNSNSTAGLIKYNDSGQIIWSRYIRQSGGQNKNCIPYSIVFDKNNNIYLTGIFDGNVNFGNGVTLTNSSSLRNFFLAKFDFNGTAQWAVSGALRSARAISPNKVRVDSDNNPYLGFTFDSTVTLFGTSATLSATIGQDDIGIVKYSSSGAFLNAANFGSSAYNEDFTDFSFDGDNNIYLLGYSTGTFNFAGSQLANTGEVILKLDSALQPIKGKKTSLNSSIPCTKGIAALENGRFVVVNNFYDSVNYGNNIWLKSPWSYNPISGLYHTMGVVFYDSTINPIWARKNDTISPTQTYITPIGVSIRNDNIYFGGGYGNVSTKLGPSVLQFSFGQQKLFIAKMDTLGNFLWSFGNNDSISVGSGSKTAIDKKGNAYLTGFYRNKISIFGESANGFGSLDFYLAKISDYTITRGFVSSGPYCAGDTIKVPYTITGFYNTGNEFIAQLSDSAGNFAGNERELGRVTDTAAGIINGFLPLFNVATTNKYRIRIISTSPVVQSYYKLDTLRLLIYSKDSANAGPDTTICKDQSIRLGTTGGSRWNWWPPTYMPNLADTANRQPLVKPDSTFEYRIIISDSSGCGDIDTDYVKVIIRPEIEVSIAGDSVVCKGYKQNLDAVITGGNPDKYWYKWKVVGLNIIQGTNRKLFVGPGSTTNYMVIVGDSCGQKIDTAFFTVNVLTDLKAHPSNDTTICKGKPAVLSVVGTGCRPDKYTYQWFVDGANTLLSTNDSITVSPGSTTKYRVILRDTSTLLLDIATITVTVDSIFSIHTLPDTTICTGRSIDLKAWVFSCDTSQMVYTWNNGLGTGDTKTVSPATTTVYRVIGQNQFNGLKDTAFVKVSVRLPLSLGINTDTTICSGQTAELRATVSGGRSSTRTVTWSEVGGAWTSTNLTETVSPSITTTYKALLTDNCSLQNDSALIKITVRPPLKVSVNTDTTICLGESAQLRATISGGYVPGYKLLWTADSGPWTSSSSITTVTPNTTTTFKALLKDNCSTPDDSATITVTVRSPLKVTVNTDTTICVGESAELRATPSGGYAPQYTILWTADSGPWTSSNITETVSPITTTTYKAVLNDNCSLQNDSALIKVTVRSPLSVTAVAKDSICSNEILLLTATASGGFATNHQILWTVDGGPWTSAQNPATDTPKVSSKYIVQLSDNCSPDVFDTVDVVVLPIPKADFTIDPAQGCPPLTVSFKDASTGNDTLQNSWTLGSAEYSGVSGGAHEFTKTGLYNVELKVSNALGCTDQKLQYGAVSVFEKPTAGFVAKPEIKEVESPVLLYNHSQRAWSYTWDFGNGNLLYQTNRNDTFYTYNDTGLQTLMLVAESSQGCKDTAILQIRIFDKINCVIPSAFTPNNGDNLNPLFGPVCVGVANYTLTIYNRWGQVIQQCENCMWDGTYDGQAVPQGIYMYKLQLLGDSKLKSLTYGTVNVVR